MRFCRDSVGREEGKKRGGGTVLRVERVQHNANTVRLPAHRQMMARATANGRHFKSNSTQTASLVAIHLDRQAEIHTRIDSISLVRKLTCAW